MERKSKKKTSAGEQKRRSNIVTGPTLGGTAINNFLATNSGGCGTSTGN